jgi:uncharacterized membrane protein
MKGTLEFFKTTLLGGLVVLIPLAVVAFVVVSVLGILIEVTALVAEYLPPEIELSPLASILIALLALIGFCFLAGLLLRTGPGDSIKSWIDRNINERIPMLGVIRNLTERFAGIEGTQFTPAEVDLYGSPVRALCFIVEELPDGRRAVFVPDVPTLTLGKLYIVPQESVTVLDATIGQIVNSITQWGAETNRIYEGSPGKSVSEEVDGAGPEKSG